METEPTYQFDGLTEKIILDDGRTAYKRHGFTQEPILKQVSVTDEDLNLINQFALEPLTKDKIYVGKLWLAHNRIDSDNERFSDEFLKNVILTGIVGKSFGFSWDAGHPRDGRPGNGLFYKSELVNRNNDLWVLAYFYTRTDLENVNHRDALKMITGGIWRYCSIVFIGEAIVPITDDNGDLQYWEWRGGGETLGADIVQMGAQQGAEITKAMDLLKERAGKKLRTGCKTEPVVDDTNIEPEPDIKNTFPPVITYNGEKVEVGDYGEISTTSGKSLPMQVFRAWAPPDSKYFKHFHHEKQAVDDITNAIDYKKLSGDKPEMEEPLNFCIYKDHTVDDLINLRKETKERIHGVEIETVKKVLDRITQEINQKEGRVISTANRQLFIRIYDFFTETMGAMKENMQPLKDLIDATDTSKGAVEPEPADDKGANTPTDTPDEPVAQKILSDEEFVKMVEEETETVKVLTESEFRRLMMDISDNADVA